MVPLYAGLVHAGFLPLLRAAAPRLIYAPGPSPHLRRGHADAFERDSAAPFGAIARLLTTLPATR